MMTRVVAVIFAISATPTTTVPIAHTPVLRGGGRDWWEIVGTLVGIGVLGLTGYLVYALRRTHAYCDFGTAVWRPAGEGVLHIDIPVHIVPGGPSWVRKKYRVSFKCNGAPLVVVPREEIPRQSAKEYEHDIRYEMNDPKGPIDVDIRVKFKHGGHAEFSQRLERP